ncbi:hypothetical protein HN51_047641 [Arachis hypogaea]|uniref:lysine-specific demethylase REF6-like n=1 Tax=Arachis hypogaea TaxID=3818 RepID=UPI003B221222
MIIIYSISSSLLLRPIIVVRHNYCSGGLGPLEVETLFWKATIDKPFSVEYANDMPGSAFSWKCREECAAALAESAWNIREISRANGSLLRFMKEEIHGVTSPMVYLAMLFSWFVWHVEDHDLHSLNYLYMGSGKTWYGVPRDAAVAFKDVVKVHGYGSEINPLGEFSSLFAGDNRVFVSLDFEFQFALLLSPTPKF